MLITCSSSNPLIAFHAHPWANWQLQVRLVTSPSCMLGARVQSWEAMIPPKKRVWFPLKKNRCPLHAYINSFKQCNTLCTNMEWYFRKMNAILKGGYNWRNKSELQYMEIFILKALHQEGKPVSVRGLPYSRPNIDTLWEYINAVVTSLYSDPSFSKGDNTQSCSYNSPSRSPTPAVFVCSSYSSAFIK